MNEEKLKEKLKVMVRNIVKNSADLEEVLDEQEQRGAYDQAISAIQKLERWLDIAKVVIAIEKGAPHLCYAEVYNIAKMICDENVDIYKEVG